MAMLTLESAPVRETIPFPNPYHSLPSVRLFGIEIAAATRAQVTAEVMRWVREPINRCRFVVTPNVDHLVQLHEGGPLCEAYEHANLVTADGAPIVAASRMFGKPLPERVTGSDLVPDLFNLTSAEQPLRVFLLGAAPGVAERAAENVHQRWPHVKVVGTDSPPLGFEKSEKESARILGLVRDASPDVLVVGFGAPKQELWVNKHRELLDTRVALCVGATIDFLAEEKARAPIWMQKLGIEFLHRVVTEPRRLFARYAHDAWVFPQILWKEYRQGGK
ncbi:WecB/TagA/CpsF family glycosyltransferase [Calycomorphotria hydatis]|uniref:N-acetylmannosaminyltransferase n=1 Tax=Calycomorphotria hydatis TaxID=2528027 RepID=A0A517TCS0_9PLAN|nr:WecB/TagA/CpsF family glycosyltransferase [Calycomorphotria hydatis]QDT66165.1 Putative N-acetylmannosaminyltransferase [Calycomorphotria hydatis]